MVKPSNIDRRRITRRDFLGRVAAAGIGAVAAQTSFTAAHATASARPDGEGLVGVSGTSFTLGGKPLFFGGTNDYYLHYKSHKMIDDVLNDAAAMRLKVIRLWGFLDGRSADGFVMQPSPGMYDENGFERFDYAVWKARQLGLRFVVPLVNNWNDFGGMNQYVEWCGGSSHDDFYTNDRIKATYKKYVSHFLHRENRYTGIVYKHEPTIMTWELANEPRCDSDTTGNTLASWAGEMSTFIKRLDRDHLVAVGDEGFYNHAGSDDWTRNGGVGVDWDRLIALPNVDYGTVHLYPDHWGKTTDWGTQWIQDHIRDAHAAGKPVVLEEYGWKGQSTRDSVYQTWTDTVYDEGGNGDQFWILTGEQDDGTLYPDYDGFRVVYPSATATLLAEHAARMSSRAG